MFKIRIDLSFKLFACYASRAGEQCWACGINAEFIRLVQKPHYAPLCPTEAPLLCPTNGSAHHHFPISDLFGRSYQFVTNSQFYLSKWWHSAWATNAHEEENDFVFRFNQIGDFLICCGKLSWFILLLERQKKIKTEKGLYLYSAQKYKNQNRKGFIFILSRRCKCTVSGGCFVMWGRNREAFQVMTVLVLKQPLNFFVLKQFECLRRLKTL